ncbi:MAG: sulfatase-like hydrolase/transferase [Chloroflexota bacterium]
MQANMQENTSGRPNIIFINTDQHTWNVISAYGYPHVHTPNIDRLHENGISFMRSYSTDPVCAPTRASWMTGRYTSEAGTPFNGGHLHEDMPDLGQTLRAGGYRAIHCGKWHVDGRDVHQSFDVLYGGQEPIGAGGGEYYDGAITHAAVDFLTSDTSNQPFYLQIAYLNPHDICEYGHNHEDKVIPDAVAQELLSEDILPPLPDNFDYDEREPVLHRVCRREDESLIHWRILRVVRNWSALQWRYFMWSHHRFVEKVDSEIGMVLAALEQSRYRDNTLILFSVDHGEAFGQHQMFQKFTLYEESIRVPFIVASLAESRNDNLNIPKATFDHTHFVSGVDLLPTVCDYASIAPPDDVQGMSIRPLVEGKPTEWRDFAYVESNYWGRALIFDRYKYVCEYMPHGNDDDLLPPGPDVQRLGVEQVFDLVDDPLETRNLAYDAEMHEQVQGFRQALLNFEGQLQRRRITHENPMRVIRQWGARVKAFWDAHPALLDGYRV